MSFKCGLRQIARHEKRKKKNAEKQQQNQAKIVWQGPRVDNKKLFDLIYYLFQFNCFLYVQNSF